FAHEPVEREIAIRHYGVTREGNFESTGATVLAGTEDAAALAASLGLTEAEIVAIIDRVVARMLAAREKRVKPFRDDKVLASWNGLVIAALADAALGLGEPALLAAAEKAFDHVTRKLVNDGRVMRLVKDDTVKGPGFLDDHSFLCAAAISLFEATGDVSK